MPQEPQDNHSGAGEIDLSKILLPKKEIHSVDSAQRIDAGSLYTQEQNATLKPSEPAQNFSIGSSEPRQSSTPASPPTPPVSPPSAAVKKPEGVGPLETYQGDIARVVQDEGVSVVSIAAAEANRRGAVPLAQDESASGAGNYLRTAIFVGVGVLLFAGAGGLILYALSGNTALPKQAVGVAPFITVDGTSVVQLPANTDSDTAMNTLVAAKNSVSLSLGLVGQLYIENAATSSSASATYEDAPTLLSLLAPDIPPILLRDINPVYLLGVHSYGINQPFLILKVDSYEQAYAGMLAWEGSMKTDLTPLFTYVPPPSIHPTRPIVIPNATTSTSSPQAPSSLPFVQTGFIDTIVNNHDARVLENQDGTIYFLWTFLDRQTIVVTTNPDTLEAIITRLTEAPVTALPGQ